jgi:hypothetical protein
MSAFKGGCEDAAKILTIDRHQVLEFARSNGIRPANSQLNIAGSFVTQSLTIFHDRSENL